MPRSQSTMTVIFSGTAGAKACSSSTVGSIQEPGWSACRMCQATGMAQLRYTTLMTMAVVWSPLRVGSMAKAKPPDRHQQRTHRSSGAKQRVTSSSVWQGVARSPPS